MLVLSEARTEAPRTTSERDNRLITDAAQLVGCRVYFIPSDFDECGSAENALWHIPDQEVLTPAVWIGFIPPDGHYDEVYEAALAKNICLVNSPDEHRNALEFARAYPRISDLTPETYILDTPNQWQAAAERFGYPVFVRGSVRSRKSAGWNSCVAETPAELEGIVNHLFTSPFRTRGSVLVRRLVRLRHVRRTENGFPVGREFRVFLYRNTVLGLGYYWDGDDPLATLNEAEETTIRTLAQQASERIGTPFLCVDIGQLESGDWIVIEVGDANFAGHGQMPLIPFWQNVKRALEQE